MLRTLLYQLRLIGWGPLAICCLVFGGLILLVASDAGSGGFPTLAGYAAIAASFLASILVPAALKPEERPALELQTSVLEPFSRQIAHLALIYTGTVLLAGLATLSLAFILLPGSSPLQVLLAAANLIALTVLFGCGGLLATVYGRDSRLGQLAGLILFSLLLVVNIPALPDAFYPYSIRPAVSTPLFWAFARLVFLSLGLIAGRVALHQMADTDRLFVGSSDAVRQSQDRQPPTAHLLVSLNKFLARPLPPLPTRYLSVVTYEAILSLLRGPLPALILVMAAVFLYFLPLVEFFQSPEPGILLVELTSGLPRSLVYFCLPILPFILADTFPSDRRERVDNLMLTTLSPSAYFACKVAGACIAAAGLALVTLLPWLLFLGLVALIGSPEPFLAFAGILFLGFLPALVYISAMSVLIGALAGYRRPLVVGGLLVVVAIVLLVVTGNSLLGNILYPSGLMAIETLGAWLRGETGIQYDSVLNIRTIVPFPVLFLPPLSALAQIFAVSRLVSVHFEHERMTA
jgi:hypothetical protein